MSIKNTEAIEKELNRAQEEAANSSAVFVHQLSVPVDYNGKKYDSLSFDFDKLTGDDGLRIEDELQAIGKPAIVPAFSGQYLIRMAAKACTEPIGADIFSTMKLLDYNKIRSAARSFLLKSE